MEYTNLTTGDIESVYTRNYPDPLNNKGELIYPLFAQGGSYDEDGLRLYLNSGISDSYSGTGVDWFDLTSNSFDALLYNDPVYSTNNGGLLALNGVDNYADVDPTFEVDLSKEFTVRMIVNPSSLATSRHALATFKTSAGTSFTIFIFASNNQVLVTSMGNNIVNSRTVTPLIADTFNEVLIKYNNGGITLLGSFEIYINQVEDSRASGANLGNGTNITTIGAVPIGTGRFFLWRGYIPKVEVFDKLTTTAEDLSRYNADKLIYNLP